MSAGLLGAIAGVGPGITTGLNEKERRAASKSQRVINEAVESRNAKRFEWEQQMGDEYQWGRNWVDNPASTYENYLPPQTTDPTGAQPQSYALPTNQGQQMDAPMIMGNQMAAAQDGGAIEVPAQPPVTTGNQGAVPAGQTPVPDEGLGTMSAPGRPSTAAIPGEAQAGGLSRRDRYNHWHGRMSRLAFLNEGLEGVRQFQEMEDAMSRRQVLGYALQAVRAMDEGNVGEAMRAGNSALEVTPFDTGLSFEASNGQLFMMGADGVPGEALNADHLRAFVDDHMKTPENYLAWRQQYETERSNQAREGTQQFSAETARRQADQWVTEGAGRDLLRRAQSYAALASGARDMASALDTGEEGLAWNENNILKIQEMEETAMDGGLGFGGMWMAEGGANSELHNQAIGDAIEIRVANAPNAMTHNDASTISRMAYFNMLRDPRSGEVAPPSTMMLDMLRDVSFMVDDQTGAYAINYKGRPLRVPPHVAERIRQNQADFANYEPE